MKNKKKNDLGGLLAIAVFIFIVVCGYTLGKFIFHKYNEKHNTNYTIQDIFTIIQYGDKDSNISNALTFDNVKTIKDLCGFDTGVCDKVVGTITLDNKSYNLYIYYNFDNSTEEISYFKIGDIKIGNFINLDDIYVFNNKYLVITEPNNQDKNYLIHFYNKEGKEIKNLTGTYKDGEILLNNGILNYYYCDSNDTQENVGAALKLYSITENNDILTNTELSKEYGKC